MAGNSWNPNASATLGLEWQPTVESSPLVNTDAGMVGQRLVSKAAENIANVKLFTPTHVAPTSFPRRYIVDVYPLGSEVAGAATCVRIAPNLIAGAPTWTASAGTLLGAIDSGWGAACTDGVVSDGDYATGVGGGATMDLEFATGAVALNTRYTNVAVGFNTLSDPLGGTRLVVELVHVASGLTFTVFPSTTPTYSGVMYVASFGEVNPHTGEPWTPAEIRSFDTGTYRIRFRTTTGSYFVNVDAVWLQLTTVTEARVARAVVSSASVVAAGWTTAAVKAINTGTGVHSGAWAKGLGTTYVYVVRRAAEANYQAPVGGSLGLAALGGTSTVPTAVGRYLVPEGSAAGLVSNTAVDTSTLLAIQPVTSTPTDSVDGTPFASIGVNEIATGIVNQQEISGATAVAYGVITTAVRAQAGVSATPSANMVVTLRRRSDSVVMGTWTLTPADFLALPLADGAGTGWRVWRVRAVASFVLAAATQYYFEYTSTAVVGTGWRVLRLTSSDATVGAAATYEGTTNVPTVAGVDVNQADYATTVSTIPPTPTAFAVGEGSQVVPGAGPCAVTGLPFADLTWNGAIGMVGLVLYYEVQRSEDAGATWSTIATVATQNIAVSFDDHEFMFGVSTQWRVRVVRTDGVFSDWTAVVTRTIEAPACGALYFSTSTTPALNVAYTDVTEGSGPARRSYSFPDADELVVQRVYGRDGFVAFRPPERRGEQFERLLSLNFAAVPVDAELPVFDPLRDLSLADLPYVVVRNSYGDRWFAALNVPEGRVRQPGNAYYGVVKVTTLQFAASVVEV